MISKLAFQGDIKTFQIGGKSVQAEENGRHLLDVKPGDIIERKDKVLVATTPYHLPKDQIEVTDYSNPDEPKKDSLRPIKNRSDIPTDSYKVYCKIEKAKKD